MKAVEAANIAVAEAMRVSERHKGKEMHSCSTTVALEIYD